MRLMMERKLALKLKSSEREKEAILIFENRPDRECGRRV